MSWIVRNLILDSSEIRYRLKDVDIESNSYTILFDNADYNNLILLEDKIGELYTSKIITEKEFNIIVMLSNGDSYRGASKKINISQMSVREVFRSACNKIAFALGGVFTEDGYKNYMIEEYNLNDDEIEKMSAYIESNKRD